MNAELLERWRDEKVGSERITAIHLVLVRQTLKAEGRITDDSSWDTTQTVITLSGDMAWDCAVSLILAWHHYPYESWSMQVNTIRRQHQADTWWIRYEGAKQLGMNWEQFDEWDRDQRKAQVTA